VPRLGPVPAAAVLRKFNPPKAVVRLRQQRQPARDFLGNNSRNTPPAFAAKSATRKIHERTLLLLLLLLSLSLPLSRVPTEEHVHKIIHIRILHGTACEKNNQ